MLSGYLVEILAPEKVKKPIKESRRGSKGRIGKGSVKGTKKVRSKRDWGKKGEGEGKGYSGGRYGVMGYGVSNEDELWSLGEKHVHEGRFECVGNGGDVNIQV